MKTSYNWLSEHIEMPTNIDKLVEQLTLLGLECSYNKVRTTFKNVVIGYVEKCKKHPDSDHLRICEVNIGEKSNIEIICGAPNIRKDIFVPVAPIGSSLDNGKFKIKKIKLRGVISNGMICSEKELNIGDDHQGIMILNTCESNIGKLFEKVYKIEDDFIIEFDITPNRGDCFSHLGIAREIALIEDKDIISSKYNFKTSNYNISDKIKVNLLEEELCPRYSCRLVKNVNVGKSPDWLKKKIESIGQKSINNIVDIANYIMFDTGQPLHAFDYDKIIGKEINIKLAQTNQIFTSINNIDYKLKNDDLVISDSKKPLAIAGIIGGSNSHVTTETKNILIESAVFNDIKIRKTSKFHDVATDSSKRFERGVDIDNTIDAMNKFISILLEICGGEVSSDLFDFYPKKVINKKIKFDLKLCNGFLGININEKQVLDIFKKLNFKLNKISPNILSCIVPLYRNDLNRSVDLYEEVARVYGYDNIPSLQSCKIPYKVLIEDKMSIENDLRQFLVSNGFNEHYSNSLISKKDSQFSNKIPVKLANPLSNDMLYLRNSILPGLFKALSFNERRKQSNVSLFEIGSIQYSKKETFDLNDIIENRFLGIAWLVNDIKHWQGNIKIDIFEVKGMILKILHKYNIFNADLFESNNSFTDLSIDIKINNHYLGSIYKLNTEIKKQYNLKSENFTAIINLDKLMRYRSDNLIKFVKPSQYPGTSRDISILVNSKVKNIDLKKCIFENAGELLTNIQLFDYYKGKDIDDDKVSLSYSLLFQSFSRTLHDVEIDEIIIRILSSLSKKYKAIQR